MVASLLRSLASIGRRWMWKPLNFPQSNFARIPPSQKLEEATIPGYVAAQYYPACIGEMFRGRYQIVGKLGFGVSSTVWLARDLRGRRHVALKVFINAASRSQDRYVEDELNIYKRMEWGSKSHPGYASVRSMLDSFDIEGPDGRHRCLVHVPLWESLLAFLHRNPAQRLPAPLLASALRSVFLALDFLHTECRNIHTDIKADNIMFSIADDSVFQDFEEEELRSPCPRKEMDGRIIYKSRELRPPRQWGGLVLCDFGSAVSGDMERTEDIQPNVYRAPEVILGVPWTYSVDLWNVGCMIWDLFEGGHLFNGHDPEFGTYRSRAHLAQMIALLRPPPRSLLARGSESHRFFSEDGEFCADFPIQTRITLEERESSLEAEDKAAFLRFMNKMLQWEPDMRASPAELAGDEWISKQL